jgi:hypothetical protein
VYNLNYTPATSGLTLSEAMIFIDLLNPSGRIRPWGLLSFQQKLVPEAGKKRLLEVQSGWRVKLTSPPPVSRLSAQLAILNISQTYSPPRPVTGIAYSM